MSGYIGDILYGQRFLMPPYRAVPQRRPSSSATPAARGPSGSAGPEQLRCQSAHAGDSQCTRRYNQPGTLLSCRQPVSKPLHRLLRSCSAPSPSSVSAHRSAAGQPTGSGLGPGDIHGAHLASHAAGIVPTSRFNGSSPIPHAAHGCWLPLRCAESQRAVAGQLT